MEDSEFIIRYKTRDDRDLLALFPSKESALEWVTGNTEGRGADCNPQRLSVGKVEWLPLGEELPRCPRVRGGIHLGLFRGETCPDCGEVVQ